MASGKPHSMGPCGLCCSFLHSMSSALCKLSAALCGAGHFVLWTGGKGPECFILLNGEDLESDT